MTSETCVHAPPYVSRACEHLLAALAMPPERVRLFSGIGTDYVWVCSACADSGPGTLADICAECLREIRPGVGDAASFRGTPAILIRPSNLKFDGKVVALSPRLPGEMIGLTPMVEGGRNLWLAFTEGGELIQMDMDRGAWRGLMSIERGSNGCFFGEESYPETVARKRSLAGLRPAAMARHGSSQSHRVVREEDEKHFPMLVAVPGGGRYVAICNRWGERGLVVDLEEGREVLTLKRNYHAEQTDWPVAFTTHDDRPVVIHGSAWNRLEATDLTSGANIVERPMHEVREDREPLSHYLDYFHGRLDLCPDGRWILDNGWIWHPVGAPASWSVTAWFTSNPWESEDGPSKRYLCYRDYMWDSPACWVGPGLVTIWGFGEDEELMIDAARVFDVATGEELRWFAGPAGKFAYDNYLFSFGESFGTSVWDVVTGECLLVDPATRPVSYHPGARAFLSITEDGLAVSHLIDPR